MQVIDTSRLKTVMPFPDAPPPGHVSLRPESIDDVAPWAATRGSGIVHPNTQDILDAILDDEIRLPKP